MAIQTSVNSLQYEDSIIGKGKKSGFRELIIASSLCYGPAGGRLPLDATLIFKVE